MHVRGVRARCNDGIDILVHEWRMVELGPGQNGADTKYKREEVNRPHGDVKIRRKQIKRMKPDARPGVEYTVSKEWL